ncbi:alpha/beta fold hydrolase [Streptosporangium amethystogenes]|uniref:alpha/beta fold hydrolase n=1 Tax=Streptosporangium amethystogenes TaxID=2002 RepID=UPI0037A6DA78
MGETHDTWSVDLPGFGRSGTPAPPLTLPALADVVAGWLAVAGLEWACLLGGSFGCQVAVDVAARHPGLTGALVLVGPTVDPRARFAPRLVGRWLRNAAGESPRMVPLNIADYRDAGLRRLLATFAAAARDRIEDRLPFVGVPALVVRGGRDHMVSQEWAEQVTRLLPGGRLVVMDGLAHMVPYLDPQGLSQIVAGFLKEAGNETGHETGREAGHEAR